jgi:dienelactone hydrolase
LTEIIGESFPAADSINLEVEDSEDAQNCVKGLIWKPSSFVTTVNPPARVGQGDALVRFPSPISSGDDRNDSVAMEWYMCRDAEQRPVRARAVVVVHESGSGMTVGRLFARGFHHRGFHAFLIHLPYYGQRRDGKRPHDRLFFTLLRQAIADVRRAHDAVASLPHIDASHIALQGTSLGGFVSATSASLDEAYDTVFLTLAGGKLFNVIQQGQKDAAKLRATLAAAGISGEDLRALVYPIEPTRIAHRMNPERTWLYSGTFDSVVPLESASALAKAANLDSTHHIKLLANHYTGIIFLPAILDHMRDQIDGIGAVDRGDETPERSETFERSEKAVHPAAASQ